MNIVGHTTAARLLSEHLPQVTVLVGPASVGKWTLVDQLAEHHRVAAVDRFTGPQVLTAATAREIVTFAHRAPLGPFKLVTARLHGASTAALNILLKSLEEPPPSTRFLLTASASVLPTVVSRAVVYHLGLLRFEQLVTILVDQGVPAATARAAAAAGKGQVRPALAAAAGSDEARATVCALVKAIATGDRKAYEQAFADFDQRSYELLNTWLCEAVTRRWVTFTEADCAGLHRRPQQLWRMLAAVSQLHAATPRLGVRAALEPFLTA